MPPSSIPPPLTRPNCLFKASKSKPNLQFTRNAATYRRHIKKLSIPPAPSFLPQKPSRKQVDIPPSSHVIFNPPPSAPNVYHTPLKFLPHEDQRRKLYSSPTRKSLYNVAANSKTNPIASPVAKPGTALHEIAKSMPTSLLPRVPESDPMPPPLKPVVQKKYHLTPDDFAEMKRLRDEDSRTWTIKALAEKFQCSVFFVQLCAQNPEAGMRHQQRIEEGRSRWGRRKMMAYQDRLRRRELWRRDA